MRILVKLGGSLLDSSESRTRLAREIASAAASGERVVVVHGGGKQMTRFLAERGVESRFVDGLRVTTPEVVDAVLKVFAGSVNHELVASFVSAGAPAVGLSGIDAALTEAEPMREDLGAVGRVTRSNPGVLEVLTASGYLPVVACVAGDRSGRIYNVNADQMAVACGAAFQVHRIIFLTDVDGVRGADGSIIGELTVADCRRLIDEKVATGGMQAKLNAACQAIEGGVPEVYIVNGGRPGIVREVLDGGAAGSRLVRQSATGGGA